MNKFHLAIIGGGAAGSMAAISAASKNKSVILLERNDKIGKKILATGNGRCNLTNINAAADRYHGASPEFINSVLRKFDQRKTMSFFESLGIILKEEDNGRIFPRNNQASTIRDTLEYEIKRKNVCIKTNSLVRKIEKNIDWQILLENGQEIRAEKLIITTGGKAACQFGSSGDGYYWAEKLGHKINTTYPALVPIETEEKWVKDVQGTKVEGKVSVSLSNKIIGHKQEDILFTHFGLSGPAVMAQARLMAAKIGSDSLKIHLDLFPEISNKDLNEKIKKIFETSGAKFVKNCLGGAIPVNLAVVILRNISINPEKKVATISKVDREKIVVNLKNIELTPKKLLSFKEAQVTSGGVCADEINPETMESKIVPGLYFAGEIIDVDGDSGGFNLQWAWSSGHLAGISASK